MSLLIRCDWCGAETEDVRLTVDSGDGCRCCSQPEAYAYGPSQWYCHHNAAGGPDKWECPDCSAKRFEAQRAKTAVRYADIEAAMKRANAKARYGDDDE